METISNNDFYSVLILSSILLLILGVATIIYIAIFKKKEMDLMQQNLKQKQAFDAELLQTQIEIQEQTLKTISQEIHDNIGQILILTRLNLSTIVLDDEVLNEKINSSKQLLGKAIVDLKDISNSLDTDSIKDIGFLKAVANQIEFINKNNIRAALTINGDEEKFDPKTALILFRMVQECLTNAIKHSKASKIDISANYYHDYFELIIVDNGIGFNAEKIEGKGLGLKNMQNRIKFIGASLNINSTYTGTVIKIIIPKK